ncbi:MAG: tyrosine-type recombinase/integrase [Rhizobiaceae bacterium]
MRPGRSPGPNPYPGVSRHVDRHGKARWRYRARGISPIYLPGPYGSAEFRSAYEKARSEDAIIEQRQSRHDHGTFNWLIEQYRQTPSWHKLAPISRKNLLNELERFRIEHGEKTVAGLRLEHVEALIAKKSATPASANRLLKLLRRLCRFAMRRGLITRDPTIGVDRFAENPDGFHTWTDAEIATFEAFHGVDSKAVLALRLMLYAGAARQDVCRMGWRNVSGDRIAYRRGKTGGDVDLPILPELKEVLDKVSRKQSLLVTHSQDKPYKPETIGNWFHERCLEAGLCHCTPHGLRKAGATRLADAGATEFEVMAFLGHKSPTEARTYTKRANRKALADSGMAKLVNSSRAAAR